MTFTKPSRMTAATTSTTIGSARMSRSSASAMDRRGRAIAGSGPAECGVDERLRLSSKGDGVADAVDGLVAKGDVEGVGLVRVRADEGRELAGARVAFAAAPDRFHVGRDRHQLGEVVLQFAVVVGGIEQAFAIGSAIWIGEDGEAREVNLPAAKELDARIVGPPIEPPAPDVVSDRPEDGAQGFLLAAANRREHGQRSRHHVCA